MPTLSPNTLMTLVPQTSKRNSHRKEGRKVYLFCDEFTNYNDAHIGITAILLLEKLGYEVIIPKHEESGRTWLSKGLCAKHKRSSTGILRGAGAAGISETPLIGIEPSAILTFRDEYPDLATDEIWKRAQGNVETCVPGG
jgi:Fe-S oxidoreductase